MEFEIENGVLKKYTEEPGVTEVVIPDVLTPKMIQFEDSAIPFEFAYTI